MNENKEEVKDYDSQEEKKDEINETIDTNRIVAEMIKGLSIMDRKYHGKTYPRCFVGKEAVQWLIDQGVIWIYISMLKQWKMLCLWGTH